MKKLVSIFLLALAVLTGCAPSLEEEKPAPLTEKELLETDGEYLDAAGKVIALKDVTADNWYKVRLTYPVDFVNETQLETYKAAYESVSVDENNRVTVVMSKDQYENLKASADAAIEEEFKACTDGTLSNVLPNIASVQSDELYKETCVYISGDFSKEQVTQLSFILCKEIYTYKTLVGNNSETKVIVVDKDTGAVYGELSYKDVYKYMNKETEENES